MKKLLVVAVVGMLAATAPLAAHADGPGYKGGCRLESENDTTPGGLFGGPNVWIGEASILVVADDAGQISGNCSIKVNGASQGVVLDAGTGPGFVANAGRVTYTAAVTDVVSLCTNVTTRAGSSSICQTLFSTPLCPVQVCGPGGVLDQVAALLDDAIWQVDATACPTLASLAPVVDSLWTADVLYIDPVTGDVFLGSAPKRAYDCPPYAP